MSGVVAYLNQLIAKDNAVLGAQSWPYRAEQLRELQVELHPGAVAALARIALGEIKADNATNQDDYRAGILEARAGIRELSGVVDQRSGT